jgi:type II secretory pathway pseudopilin PulG
VVIVIIGILAAITTTAYNGVNEKANKAVAVADLNNVHKLVENYQTTNMNPPSVIGDINDGQGYHASEGSIVRYTATGLNYCITINRGDYYVMYDSATGNRQDGYCEGHGPAEPAEIVYFSGLSGYPGQDTTYPLTPGVALQNDDVVVSFHTEHYIAGTGYLRVDGVNIPNTLQKSLSTGADVFRVTVATNITPSTLLSFRTDTGANTSMAYFIIRGLHNPDTFNFTQAGWSGGLVYSGGDITIPSQPLKTGQAAILAINALSIIPSDLEFPYSSEPTIGHWTKDGVYDDIGLAHVIGTSDTTSVGSKIQILDMNFVGGTIFVFGS